MKRTSIIILGIIFILFLLFSCGGPNPVSTDNAFDEIDVTSDPIQTDLSGNDIITKEVGDLKIDIILKAEYHVAAMVMSKKKYSGDWSSLISKYDLALAWGDLTKPEVYKHIDFSQKHRWYYFYNNEGSPITIDFIYTHSANTHIIHATDNIKYALRKKVKKHTKVVLDGYLVYIKGTYKGGDVWWNSSLSRNDRGDGACEILYCTKLRVGEDIYE